MVKKSNITPSGVAGRPLTSVVVSPLNFDEVVITASGFTGGGKHVFVSSNAGASWTDISAGLPDVPMLSAAFDPVAPFQSLYVGTDIGVFHTADLGSTWTNANLGSLPAVPVYRLRAGAGTVLAATHGRGVWKFATPAPTATPTATPIAAATGTATPTPTSTPIDTSTPTASATLAGSPTPTLNPTPSPTPTPIPGHPFIASVPGVILVGGSFDIQGLNFTAGSMVNFFVATANGAVNGGPLRPAFRTATDLTINVPPSVSLGQGFVSLQVVNTDHAFAVSNLGFALLQGSASKGIPTVLGVDGVGLASTSSDPSFATDNVEAVVTQGSVVQLSGSGFDVVNGVAVDLFCACPGGKVGPFFLTPGAPGLSAGSIAFTLPAGGSNSPADGPGSFVVSNRGAAGTYAAKSNAVSLPIGAQIFVVSVSQSGSTVTVNGGGFASVTVVNLFNLQGSAVVNLGGFAGGVPAIPIKLLNSSQFTFTVPLGAVPGPSYVQALNPPFVPFTSSGNDPGGAFTLH